MEPEDEEFFEPEDDEDDRDRLARAVIRHMRNDPGFKTKIFGAGAEDQTRAAVQDAYSREHPAGATAIRWNEVRSDAGYRLAKRMFYRLSDVPRSVCGHHTDSRRGTIAAAEVNFLLVSKPWATYCEPCFRQLEQAEARSWGACDVCGQGPQSLASLRFVYSFFIAGGSVCARCLAELGRKHPSKFG